MLQSPLNYTGGKFKLLKQIKPLFPSSIDLFVDLFCGGCNVGINIPAKHHLYNDLNAHIYHFYNFLKNVSSQDFIHQIYLIIDDFNLSLVSHYGYEQYGCNGSSGLAQYNKNKFIALRNYFNNFSKRDLTYYAMFYVLIAYGFNNQIRFNRSNEFNNPVGKRDFNDQMKEKLISFIKVIQDQDAIFENSNFTDFQYDKLGKNDFVYVDPPYLITEATYNEQKGWNEELEKKLFKLLDELNARQIKFALSNVIESKGNTNHLLQDWLEQNSYKRIDLDYSYNNANYHRKSKGSVTKEVLIINY